MWFIFYVVKGTNNLKIYGYPIFPVLFVENIMLSALHCVSLVQNKFNPCVSVLLFH